MHFLNDAQNTIKLDDCWWSFDKKKKKKKKKKTFLMKKHWISSAEVPIVSAKNAWFGQECYQGV